MLFALSVKDELLCMLNIIFPGSSTYFSPLLLRLCFILILFFRSGWPFQAFFYRDPDYLINFSLLPLSTHANQMSTSQPLLTLGSNITILSVYYPPFQHLSLSNYNFAPSVNTLSTLSASNHRTNNLIPILLGAMTS